jgi:hypothetical protein
MSKKPWDAQDFVARLEAGEFDGRITEAIHALSLEQMREVEQILLDHPVFKHEPEGALKF